MRRSPQCCSACRAGDPRRRLTKPSEQALENGEIALRMAAPAPVE